MDEDRRPDDIPAASSVPRGKAGSFINDIKYYWNLRHIIRSNRSFFARFYFGRHYPERMQALSQAGDWRTRLECLNDAVATKRAFLESIAEAIVLAERSIGSPWVKKRAVRALQREAARSTNIRV